MITQKRTRLLALTPANTAWASRTQIFSAAAEAMRQILLGHARAKQARQARRPKTGVNDLLFHPLPLIFRQFQYRQRFSIFVRYVECYFLATF